MQQRVFCVVPLAIGGLWLASAAGADAAETVTTAPQWHEVELTFTATHDTANPYTDTEAWADFTHDDGTAIRRPLFWDGGRTLRVRFASTKSSGTWRWTTADRDGDPGLRGRSGRLAAGPAMSEPATIFTRHGIWSIPPGGRNLTHADGRPRLLSGSPPSWWRTGSRPSTNRSSTATAGRVAARLATS